MARLVSVFACRLSENSVRRNSGGLEGTIHGAVKNDKRFWPARAAFGRLLERGTEAQHLNAA